MSPKYLETVFVRGQSELCPTPVPPRIRSAVAKTGKTAAGPGKATVSFITKIATTIPAKPAHAKVWRKSCGIRENDVAYTATIAPTPSSHARELVEKYAQEVLLCVSQTDQTKDAVVSIMMAIPTTRRAWSGEDAFLRLTTEKISSMSQGQMK
jgi:hypothetical protein